MRQSYIIIGIIAIVLGVAWYYNFLPGAAVVDGRDVSLLMSIGLYDDTYGMRLESYLTYGTYKTWEYGVEQGAWFTRNAIWGQWGWTEDLCNTFGANWEGDIDRCNFGSPDWSFTKRGSNLDDFKVTKTDLAIFCGGVYFNDIDINDIQIVPHGLWFPGITVKYIDMTPQQKEQAQKNAVCSVLGDVYIKHEGVAEFCGDMICQDGEDCDGCPQDCGPCASVCGNGVCDFDETYQTCPIDCPIGPYCGDGNCDFGETQDNCPDDCGEPEPEPQNPFEWIVQSIQNFFAWIFGLLGIGG